MMNTGIYLIHNVMSSKFYVGSAININKRWLNHIQSLRKQEHHNRHLQNAWNRYGEKAFRFYVIDLCRKEELVKKEQFYIDILKPEYNLSPNAGSSLGLKHTEKSKRNMSEAVKKLAQDPEWRRVNSESKKKLWKDPEFRRKSLEAKKKMVQNPEWKRNLSESKKKLWKDPEFRRKSLAARKKMVQDPEWKRKHSEASKKLAQDPKWLESVNKILQSPERRKKQSDFMKRYWAQKRKKLPVV